MCRENARLRIGQAKLLPKFRGNSFIMLSEKIHQSQVTQVLRLGMAVVASSGKSATDGRDRSTAN